MLRLYRHAPLVSYLRLRAHGIRRCRVACLVVPFPNMKALACLFSLAMLAACGGSGLAPSAPLGQSAVASSAPPGPSTPRLSGDAHDTANRPIADARIEVLDGPQAGAFTTTDALGRFSIAGEYDDTVRFRASKPGHVSKTQTSRRPCDTCERYLGFLLELEMPPTNLTGDYTLTFTADPGCVGIPESARVRSYTATVRPHANIPWLFDVSIVDGATLHGYGWEGMSLSAAADAVSMVVGNLHGTPGLVEQVAPDRYVAFDGVSNSSLVAPFSTVTASFDGVFEYCQQPTGSLSPVATGAYACMPANPVNDVRCESKNHSFTLSRR